MSADVFVNDYFDSDYYNEYFGDSGGGPTSPSGGFGGKPIVVIASMTSSWYTGGGSTSTQLSLYPRVIFWDAPQNSGDVLQIEDGNGNVLFKATAASQYDSRYVVLNKRWESPGIRWRDFIVTTISSGTLYLWATT